mmetsp:Transcript_57997/g.86154  ORF Transcript_57997/g.86154 Transcript_57997/m.86154 type:complete len:194 (+) Transcript_57997:821-1402(+)
MASTASSILYMTRRWDPRRYSHPAIIPITNPAHGSTVAHGAVIATRPVRHPFIAAVRSYVVTPVLLVSRMLFVNNAETAPAAAPSVVFTAAKEATSPSFSDEIFSVEPGLKPYQPNHKQNVPRNWSENRRQEGELVDKMNVIWKNKWPKVSIQWLDKVSPVMRQSEEEILWEHLINCHQNHETDLFVDLGQEP